MEKTIKRKKLLYEITGHESSAQIEESEPLVLSQSVVPAWYRDTPRTELKDFESISKGKNFKFCVPFGDSLTTGYMMVTPCDIIIERDPISKRPKIHTSLDTTIFTTRDPIGKGLMPYPDGCYKMDFIFKHPLHLKLPRGYSALITHPLNRNDLPWIVLSAVVDADVQPLRPGNMPLFIKENFEGIIPKGTPIFQLIPFKRENWEKQKDPGLVKSFVKHIYNVNSVIYGWYKDNAWTRKNYS